MVEIASISRITTTAANGLEIQVRYLTRGPQRYEVKSRLFRQIVEVLHGE